MVRGPRKKILMGQGLIRSELEIKKCWIEGEIMDFLEKKFEKKLNQIPNKDGKFWYEKCLSPFFSYPFSETRQYKSSRVE